MEAIKIIGGKPLYGEVEICGAKNAVVGLLPAVLLAEDGVCRIDNVPNISDVSMMIEILKSLGATVKTVKRNAIEIDARHIITDVVPHDTAKNLRASYYFIGALLGRFGSAKVALPGGCDFGVRPIDQHIKSFESLGATVNIENGMVNAKAEKLSGTFIYMDVVSVGATINAMLASVKANGITTIENAAKEPHIVDVANFLNSMGADIRGAGTTTIKIHGVEKLHGCSYSVIPDQIEAGTYMVAVAATGGDVLIKNVIPKHLESITAKLIECGVEVTEYDDSIRVKRDKPISSCNITTMPHPGFPTDMQPQFVAMLAGANGISIISESVWDNRFKYVDQLIKMGAKIEVKNGNIAVITGVERLTGSPVGATDLRAGAALVIAGLCAEGETLVEKINYIERGYERIVDKFKALGAQINYVHRPDESAAMLAR